MKSSLFVVSWALLLLLVAALIFIPVVSAMNAFGKAPDSLTPSYSVQDLEATNAEAATAVRGRRVTAATWALGYGLLALYVVLVPYRRGERWAWWALLLSLGISQLVSLARVPVLGTQQGAAASGMLLALLLLGLMTGAPRMFAKSKD